MPTPSRPRKVDRRVIRTRKAIMNAFDKLVSSGDIDKITVSAIAREADIDRKTFYLHYSSVDDLANRKAEEAIERIIGRVQAEGEGASRAKRIHLMLDEANAILTGNIAVYANIASRLSTDQILERFEAALGPVLARSGLDPAATEDRRRHMRLQFYIAGALSVYASWLKSDRTEPIETVSATIESAIR